MVSIGTGGVNFPVGRLLGPPQNGSSAKPRPSVNREAPGSLRRPQTGFVSSMSVAEDFEYSPEDLAAVCSGQTPGRAGEACDDAEPSPVQVRV